ncbi:MAG: CoA transferase [Actinomycetota bacterium]|jgi:hypothetical protein|nr:CoA transferase [Actinomycetota bacterium]
MSWLPDGLHELAAEHGRAIDTSLGAEVVGDGEWWVDLPTRVVARHTEPAAPVMWGDGALCVDLGPDDLDTWDTFSSVVAGDPDPESVARRAQVWRLAVTPYRRSVSATPVCAPPTPSSTVDLRGVRIVDMTSMWAGPLCTELLARAGASVIKIEATARPDGLRYGDGDDGTGMAPMFVELNRSKQIADLDLRHCSVGGEFQGLLREADLLISSLSTRALCNLGVDAASLADVFPDLRTLSITAFARGSAEADWVAYGTGVHAASGLGWEDDRPRAPLFSYPDPLAGLLACRHAVAQLAGDAPLHGRVSLAEAIAPLLDLAAGRR